MKNTITIIAITIALSVSACKKADRECECTYSDGTKLTITYLEKSSKRIAKKYCEKGLNVMDEEGNIDNTKDPDVSCELK